MATTNTSTSVEGAAVHDTLSPTERTHRRDSLEKHLLSRPSPQDLKEKHILLSTDAAPSLQAKQAELDKARATDSLRKGLEHRSERDDLVQRKSGLARRFKCLHSEHAVLTFSSHLNRQYLA